MTESWLYAAVSPAKVIHSSITQFFSFATALRWTPPPPPLWDNQMTFTLTDCFRLHDQHQPQWVTSTTVTTEGKGRRVVWHRDKTEGKDKCEGEDDRKTGTWEGIEKDAMLLHYSSSEWGRKVLPRKTPSQLISNFAHVQDGGVRKEKRNASRDVRRLVRPLGARK